MTPFSARTVCCLGISALALTATAPVSGAPARRTLDAAFDHPLKSERPMVRWWWPGGAVDDAELGRQLDLLDRAGIGGAEIQPFGLGIVNPPPAEKAAINGYAEPGFFAHVHAAAVAARKRGLALDYTLGSAWPSGGGLAITPEKALVELTMAATTIEGGAPGPVKLTLPVRTSRLGAFPFFDKRWDVPEAADWPARLDARAHIVAVLALRGDAPQLSKAASMIPGLKLSAWSDVANPGTLDPGSTIVLTDKLAPDGTLDWTPPPGKWQILVFKQYGVNSAVTGSAGKGPQLVLDHFDPAAFAAHLGRVGDPMVAALGSARPAVRATFVDSLELMQDLPWTEHFLAEFKARRGYDLTPYLPFVIQPGWMQAWGERYSPPYYQASGGSDLPERVRADYRQTVSDLMVDGFVKPWVAWNHQHGFLTKFQAHGGPLDLLRGYGLADIPETENLGADYDALGLRFARSAADIYGRKLVSAEALAVAGQPYAPTPGWLRRRIDMFYAGGVNAQTLHGFAYVPTAAKWPGWFPFAPSPASTGFGTMFGENNPIWAAMPTLAGYMARTNAVLRQGEAVVPVALFFGEIGNYRGIEDKGAGVETHEKALIAGGYDYDRINPDGLMQARVVDRRLVTAGGHRYAALVLAGTAALRAETAEQIAGFAKVGLPVIFTGLIPDRDVGLFDAARRDRRVRAAMARVVEAGGQSVPDGKMVAALATAKVAANLHFTTAAADVVFVERNVGRRRVYFLYNTADTPRDASFVTATQGGVARWNALDGTKAPQTARAVAGGTAIDLPLGPHQSALLVVDPATRPQVVAPPEAIRSESLPTDGWQLSVDGHGAQGVPVSRSFDTVALADFAATPELAAFSGTATFARDVSVPAGLSAKGTRVVLDLGVVCDMAVITINGHRLAPLIDAPWTRDVSTWLRAGSNHIEVAVSNGPQNAMRDPKKPGFAKLPVLPAGLIGPVTLRVLR